MKNYAKLGNRQGRTAYRTPSSFRYRKTLEKQTHDYAKTHSVSFRKQHKTSN